ncbi:MarR family winged helix-turn-helix transcriptional regulator [Mycolicibacterium baixiangningiae]|uniref:MarR family winged helix-turn-helix transcriptional regulator n=1 Tax=Mycolicibacterium baixiangningiae TaxID=2761578 RepID=UPI0018E6596D|nr:helix-turn-helix domain-containing protein [Mycolicibacterium baixiangningiae]
MSEPDEPSVAMSTTMLLIGAGRLAQRRFEAALAREGLTLRHIGALGHLSRSPELSYSDLARRARITPQSMHATMAQLVALGAVTTEARGRASYPRLTERGRELLAFAAEAAAACDEALGVDAEVRSQLARLAQQALSEG